MLPLFQSHASRTATGSGQAEARSGARAGRHQAEPIKLSMHFYGLQRAVIGSPSSMFGLARRAAVPRRAPIGLAVVGLVVPGVLMLIAIGYTFRYQLVRPQMLGRGKFDLRMAQQSA
jgi:hypothetical protein